MKNSNVINVSREIFEANGKIEDYYRNLESFSNFLDISMMNPYIYNGLECSYINSIMFLEFSNVSNENFNLFGDF